MTIDLPVEVLVVMRGDAMGMIERLPYSEVKEARIAIVNAVNKALAGTAFEKALGKGGVQE